MTDSNVELLWMFGIIVAFFLVLLLIKLVSVSLDFSRELNYINCEIRRTRGAERRHWIRKKRKLWLSLIPFIKYR